MQSFKQFLTEEIDHNMITYYSCSIKNPEILLPEFKDELEKLKQKRNDIILYHVDKIKNGKTIEFSLGMRLKLSKQNVSSFEIFNNYLQDFTIELRAITNPEKIVISHDNKIELSDVPSFPVYAQTVDFHFKKDAKISLKGIDKFVHCNTILFDNIVSNNTSPITDGGLGLLNIKELSGIRYLSFSNDCEWLEIIKKHLKSRDILECKEELINAGYKEYAKL